MASAYVSTLQAHKDSMRELDARLLASMFLSKVSMLVSTSLSRHNRVSGLDSGSLGEYLYERTHTATRVLLVLLSYLTNGEFFPLYFSHRIALCSLCWETKAKTGQWTLPRFLPEIRGDGRLVKRACEKRKWEDVDVNPYEAEKKTDSRVRTLWKHAYIRWIRRLTKYLTFSF